MERRQRAAPGAAPRAARRRAAAGDRTAAAQRRGHASAKSAEPAQAARAVRAPAPAPAPRAPEEEASSCCSRCREPRLDPRWRVPYPLNMANADSPKGTGASPAGGVAATAQLTPVKAPAATPPAGPGGGGSSEQPAAPPPGLNASQRRLLSDLFAIVSEHAADSAVAIDRARVQDAFVFACEHHARPAAQVGRGLHRAPRRRGAHLREHAPGHRDAVRGAAARHGRGHLRVDRGGARALRRGDRRDRRRRHEAHRDHLPVARRGPGEQLPQDDGGDGHRRAGHPDQARRPPAQHAHDRRDAQAEADREGARDDRDLRAARPPPGHPRDQVGARGPRLRDAVPAQVPGDQGAGRPAARGTRALRERGRRATSRNELGELGHRSRRSPGAPSTSTRSTRR